MNKRPLGRRWFAAKIAATLVAFPLFYLVVSWSTAMSREQAIAKGYAVPEGWKTVIMGHGQISEWPYGQIHDHPGAFAVCLGLLIAAYIVFFWGLWRVPFRKD